jgi:TorA maturation chaperone TorD
MKLGGVDVSVISRLLGIFKILEMRVGLSMLKLEEEYVDLFSAKPKAPPYEAVYTDPEGFSRGWIMVGLEKEYAEAGLELSPKLKEQPDHIAVELEFMAYLCGLEACAETEDVVKAMRGRQARFLEQHLWRWFPSFLNRLDEKAPTSFYLQVAEATRGFLESELEGVTANQQ